MYKSHAATCASRSPKQSAPSLPIIPRRYDQALSLCGASAALSSAHRTYMYVQTDINVNRCMHTGAFVVRRERGLVQRPPHLHVCTNRYKCQ